jgi:GAF domain-containing protein
VVGDTFSPRCLDIARAEHATRLAPDAGRRSRLAPVADGRAPALRHPPDGKGDLDVHTSSSTKPAATRRRLPALWAGPSPWRRLAGALIGLVVLPLLTLGLTQLRDVVNLPSQTLLYLLAVVVVALVGGLVPALAAAVAAAVLLDHYFIPPLNDFAIADSNNVVALVAFVLVAAAVSWVVGLAMRRREAEALATANAESREELRRLAEEQAALRRVATLVARGIPPAEVLEAVAHEVGSVLGADGTNILHLDPDGATTVAARVGAYPAEFPIGSRWKPEPPLALAAVLRTGRPARIDDFSQVSDAYGEAIRRLGLRSGVSAPIVVQGHLWGAVAVGTRHERFPADTEQRMAGFTELIGTAIANAEGRAQLEESRDELRRLAQEQAALRRVATLVARGVPPAEVFTAVAHEVRHVLGADATTIARLDPDDAMTVLARVGHHSDDLAVGSRWTPEPPLALAVALRTGRAARCDDYSQASGAFVDATVRRLGIRSSVATPIVVEGRLWGATVAGTRCEHLPADTEQRMAGFTELIGTAIANAEGRAQLEESRDELRRLAQEQAALRRVATLVARGVPPAEVFSAVADEVGIVLGADGTVIVRLDPDGATTLVASVGAHPAELPVGSRWKPEPPVAVAVALRTCRPARCDNYRQAPGEYADAVRRLGLRSSVAAPIVVEGRLWGAIGAGARHERFPADTEQRMAGFTELVGTAIANADSGAQLTASRARIVAAADEARRRIERDLHDGTQQRLVALGLALRLAQATVPPELLEPQRQIGRVADELDGTLKELHEIARGIHPAVLSEGGLGPALRTLARRAAIPVELDIRTEARWADPIEVAAYYVVSEALTNTTKHARASCAHVAVEQRDAILHLSIRDDGAGGADPAGGSGLIGLGDRVQALGGSIEVNSRPREGTAIVVELPLQPY